MSYTTMYGVPESGDIEEIKEYKNGWGSAPVVWDFLYTKYLETPEKKKNYESSLHPGNNLKELCRMANNGEFAEDFEIICQKWTHDGMIVKKEDFEKLADALDTMYKCTHKPNYVNHLKQIADDLRNLDWNGYIGACFRHTSVGDAWAVYPENDDEDSRLYDISKDRDHWFLFD